LFLAYARSKTPLTDRDERYYAFRAELNGNGDLKQRIEADPGPQDRELTLTAAFDAWWSGQEGRIVRLADPGAGTQALMVLRDELMTSFEQALVPVGLLDRFHNTQHNTTTGDTQHNNTTTGDRPRFRNSELTGKARDAEGARVPQGSHGSVSRS